MTKVLLIWGTGGISSNTVTALLQKKYDVAVFHRTKVMNEPRSNVRHYCGDRNKVYELQQVIEDYEPDIIIDFVCFTPEQAEQAIKVSDEKIKQYIFISTVDAYGYLLSKEWRQENLLLYQKMVL